MASACPRKSPTEILFGRGLIAEIAPRVPTDKPVLFVYGGGSIKRNGVCDQVRAALAKHRLVEFPGIEVGPVARLRGTYRRAALMTSFISFLAKRHRVF